MNVDTACTRLVSRSSRSGLCFGRPYFSRGTIKIYACVFVLVLAVFASCAQSELVYTYITSNQLRGLPASHCSTLTVNGHAYCAIKRNTVTSSHKTDWYDPASQERLGCFIDAVLHTRLTQPSIPAQGDLWGSLTEPSQLSSRPAAVGWVGGAKTKREYIPFEMGEVYPSALPCS